MALPIVLAHLVGRDGPATYAHVKKAADLLAGFVDSGSWLAAPYTPQDRWENQSGYSPDSIAAQIAGLVCAAERGAQPLAALPAADQGRTSERRHDVLHR